MTRLRFILKHWLGIQGMFCLVLGGSSFVLNGSVSFIDLCLVIVGYSCLLQALQ